ncbi:MAG: YraN family protein [Microcoleaceae cyanobacterium]
MNPPSGRIRSQASTQQIGVLGEQLVAQWLKLQGWQIFRHQYHCRYGEIDLIVTKPESQQLRFVEVKTRSRRNWDANGLLAITSKKQAKLLQTAQIFLSQTLDFSEFSCQFDVALVRCDQINPAGTRCSPQDSGKLIEQDLGLPQTIRQGQPIEVMGYRLILQHFLEGAFTE